MHMHMIKQDVSGKHYALSMTTIKVWKKIFLAQR